jgi:GT2 family glycosyltransferase
VDSPVSIAPPVVAVVVVHEPGPWFDEVVAALAAQDYPSLRVLALVTGTPGDTAERIRSVLPDAYVRTVEGNLGFGPAANEVLRLVEGGGFFCFLHDDVALAADAVSALIAELYRSNAGIVGPKLVEWDHPTRLLTVGLPIDKFGEFSSPVEPGELDQEQHDAIRDVFSLPSACLLVRADLFRALGGFDPEIPFFGEALDLCWRAHSSGARVLVVPDAVGRHRQAIEERNPDLDPDRLAQRHRLRTVLSGYGRLHLVRVLPQYAVMSVLDAIVRLVSGRATEAGAVLGAWPWNLARVGSLVAKRRALRGLRSVPDRELRGLQVRGSARLAAFVRAQGARRDDRLGAVTSAGRSLVHRLRTGERRASIGVWVLAILLFVLGSRTLVTGRIPVVGELLPYTDSATAMIHTYFSGWWSHGLGGAVPVPTGIGLLGAAGTVLFGHLALLHTLLVVGPLLFGWIGTWRLLAPFAVQRARIMGLAVVAGTPLAVNALATGRWSGVVAFGVTPFALGRLARVSGLEPFDGRPRPFAVHVAALGLFLAVVAAFVPSYPLVVVAMAAALVVGSLAAGGVRQSLRALVAAAAAALVAYLLNLPWTTSLVYPGARWAPFGSLALTSGNGRSLASLAVFDTGPHTLAFLAIAGYLAAFAALAVGRSWRFAWAARAWAIVVGLLAVAWAGQRGWLPFTLPAVEVVLAPVAIALGLAAASSARSDWRTPPAASEPTTRAAAIATTTSG